MGDELGGGEVVNIVAKPADTPHCNLFVLVAQFRGGSRGWGPGVWPPSPYFREKKLQKEEKQAKQKSPPQLKVSILHCQPLS